MYHEPSINVTGLATQDILSGMLPGLRTQLRCIDCRALRPA